MKGPKYAKPTSTRNEGSAAFHLQRRKDVKEKIARVLEAAVAWSNPAGKDKEEGLGGEVRETFRRMRVGQRQGREYGKRYGGRIRGGGVGLQSLPYKEDILGLGLDSTELGNPPSQYKAVYERAQAEGYKLVAHCGASPFG